jgi:hypothetical protein
VRRDGRAEATTSNTKWLAGAIAVFAAFAGDLPRAHRHLEILEAVLRRWDLPMTPDTAGFGYVGAALQLAILEGRLDDGRELARPALLVRQTEHAVPAAMVTVPSACSWTTTSC